jgi:hypothetical protein
VRGGQGDALSGIVRLERAKALDLQEVAHQLHIFLVVFDD